MIIGELGSVIHSDVCIEKLAPHLQRRRILTHEECNFFVSQQNGPNAQSNKIEKFTEALAKAADRPSTNCVKCLYLALLDSLDEQICRSNASHLRVANYLRKKGKDYFL